MARYKSRWTGPQIDDGIEKALDGSALILTVRFSVDASADMSEADAAWGNKPIFAKYAGEAGYPTYSDYYFQCTRLYEIGTYGTAGYEKYYEFTGTFRANVGKNQVTFLLREYGTTPAAMWSEKTDSISTKSHVRNAVATLDENIAYLEDDADGEALHNISQGEYLIRNDGDALSNYAYKADRNITAGEELVDSGASKNITFLDKGIANDLKSALDNKQDTLTTVVDTSPVTPSTGASVPTGTRCTVKKYGNIINLSGVLQKTLVLNQWNELGMLDSQYLDGERMYFVFLNATKDAPVEGDIDSDGTIRVWPTSSNSAAGIANIAFNIVYVIS